MCTLSLDVVSPNGFYRSFGFKASPRLTMFNLAAITFLNRHVSLRAHCLHLASLVSVVFHIERGQLDFYPANCISSLLRWIRPPSFFEALSFRVVGREWKSRTIQSIYTVCMKRMKTEAGPACAGQSVHDLSYPTVPPFRTVSKGKLKGKLRPLSERLKTLQYCPFCCQRNSECLFTYFLYNDRPFRCYFRPFSCECITAGHCGCSVLSVNAWLEIPFRLHAFNTMVVGV